MKIEGLAAAYHRLPLEAMGDAGHGAIDSGMRFSERALAPYR